VVETRRLQANARRGGLEALETLCQGRGSTSAKGLLMSYETITLTAFVSIALAAVGCLIAHIVGEWLWGKDILPPPSSSCERRHLNEWEDLE
jgi:hypothetical protein